MVSKGDIILAIDENKNLKVEGLWGDTSSTVDFQATYTETNLTDTKGIAVYGNRGFRFADEGTKWKHA